MDPRRTNSAPPPETVSSCTLNRAAFWAFDAWIRHFNFCDPWLPGSGGVTLSPTVPILEVELGLHGQRVALCTYRIRLRHEEVSSAASSNDAFVDRVYIPPMFRARMQEEEHVLRCEFRQRMHASAALPQRRAGAPLENVVRTPPPPPPPPRWRRRLRQVEAPPALRVSCRPAPAPPRTSWFYLLVLVVTFCWLASRSTFCWLTSVSHYCKSSRTEPH